jgi:hypothetical protein
MMGMPPMSARLPHRGLLYLLAILAAATALATGAGTAGAAVPLLPQLAADAAVLVSLFLLLSSVKADLTSRQRLWALALLIVGTRLLDGLTGGWELTRLVALALGALATAIWWEARDRVVPWKVGAIACLAAAAGAVSPTSLALLLLPTVAIGTDPKATPRGRVAAVMGILALGTLALVVLRINGVATAGDTPGATIPTLCASQGAWALLTGLFSSREGLFYSSPLLWLGVAGLLMLVWSEWRAALAISLCWVGACALVAAAPTLGRGLEGLVPTLAIGLAHALATLRRWTERQPLLPAATLALALVLWNFLLMTQYRGGVIPRDDTVAFARVAEGAATNVARTTGSPPGWPGNWFAAWRYGVPLERFDELVGLRLFAAAHAQHATLPLAEARTSALLLDGWGSPLPRSGHVVRRVCERAAAILPLTCAEPLDVVVVAGGSGVLTLWVNDTRAGGWMLDEAFRERRVRVTADAWRCPVSTLSLESATPSEAWVESLSLVRRAEGRP